VIPLLASRHASGLDYLKLSAFAPAADSASSHHTELCWSRFRQFESVIALLFSSICEMKRLYVKPQYQGMNIGRALAESVIQYARSVGYSRMRLDTLPRLDKALSLYKSLGFQEIAPYRDYQALEAIFMELMLKG
jgi:GNAT superfamily N-acetyltransferase